MPRQAFNSSAYFVPVAGFTQAVKARARGTLFFVSGVTARGKDGELLGVGDIAVQTRQVLENLSGLLREAGGSLDDVLKIVTYLRDMDDLLTVHEIRREYFGDPLPANTSVGVTRLFDPRALIEIEAIAILAN